MSQQSTNEVRSPSKFAKQDASLIKLDAFIVATRDSGYKGTNSAVAELVDNAIQAKSTSIHVDLYGTQNGIDSLLVSILDDGNGMKPETLRQALRFGGSSRFGDRNGLGRFGMGLPNSSLSQSRRVEVFTWTNEREIWYSYLDVDEVVDGTMAVIPEPIQSRLPENIAHKTGKTGTVVIWSRCDRLDNRRIPTLSRKLIPFLGRVFRYFLWKGVRICVNDQPVRPVDPLYLRSDSAVSGATRFGDDLTYKVSLPSEYRGKETVGNVVVRF